jgi:hypothetical protein
MLRDRHGGAIDVNQFTVATEIFPSPLRSMGTGIAMSGLFLADTLWLQLASTAMATIGWKYYLVFLWKDRRTSRTGYGGSRRRCQSLNLGTKDCPRVMIELRVASPRTREDTVAAGQDLDLDCGGEMRTHVESSVVLFRRPAYLYNRQLLVASVRRAGAILAPTWHLL